MGKAVGYIWGTLLVIAVWWTLAAAIGSPALPTPAATVPVLIAQCGAIMPEFLLSLERILVAMLIGTLIGAPLGLALGRSRRADLILGPALYILYPLPKIVLLPILFVLLGIGGEAKVTLIAIAVFFQMVVTMRDAARAIPETAVESMRSLGAGRLSTFAHLIVPASLPSLFTALRITTGTAVAILFIAESMAGSTGLGYFIMHSWSLLEYARMFAGIIAFAVMGVLIYEAFDVAERRFSTWRS
ncbi:ABC transporter permease [Adlercreutzia murintestinalis]|uniref:ABC transporter permease n=1 Tax=Adlercreutzia murintestinalis TaxID=2941325 RepID=UPI0020412EFF|nr:ABC transporter permease [Adlercreutzia murintestinalis]